MWFQFKLYFHVTNTNQQCLWDIGRWNPPTVGPFCMVVGLVRLEAWPWRVQCLQPYYSRTFLLGINFPTKDQWELYLRLTTVLIELHQLSTNVKKRYLNGRL